MRMRCRNKRLMLAARVWMAVMPTVKLSLKENGKNRMLVKSGMRMRCRKRRLVVTVVVVVLVVVAVTVVRMKTVVAVAAVLKRDSDARSG